MQPLYSLAADKRDCARFCAPLRVKSALGANRLSLRRVNNGSRRDGKPLNEPDPGKFMDLQMLIVPLEVTSGRN